MRGCRAVGVFIARQVQRGQPPPVHLVDAAQTFQEEMGAMLLFLADLRKELVMLIWA